MNIFENQSLRPFCSFQIGGTASFVINWEETSEILDIINFAKEKQLPILIIGGGSNLLFPDNHLNGVIARCMTKAISLNQNETIITVDAGVRWASLAIYMKKTDLFGLEALLSIPGSVGGAIWGNAGCHKQEIKDKLLKLEYFDVKLKKLITLDVADIVFSYRHSEFSEHRERIITRAWFKVSKSETQAHGKLRNFQLFRKEKQPQGLTTGSFFKNPYPDYAGALIEKAGLKGFRLGNVGISEKHANFVINYGGGTAQEVKELTKHVQSLVLDKYNVQLEPEVKMISLAEFTSV